MTTQTGHDGLGGIHRGLERWNETVCVCGVCQHMLGVYAEPSGLSQNCHVTCHETVM